jgi:hypothetical protein
MKKAYRSITSFLIFIVFFPLASCFDSADSGGDEPLSRYCADTVVEAPGHTGSGFGDSRKAVNGVYGAGCTAGSLDVFSLDFKSALKSNYIILRWSGRKVLNGAGIDFIVFENPFDYGSCGSGTRFMEQMVVSLSRDKTSWVDFPHNYTYDDKNSGTTNDEETYSDVPTYWSGFAGVNPVYYNEKTDNFDPSNVNGYGGDGFDLDALDESDASTGALAAEIKAHGFVYIKLTAAPTVTNPDTDTGSFFVHDTSSTGADIDGVYARYLGSEN